jgi:hypothetical protein
VDFAVVLRLHRLERSIMRQRSCPQGPWCMSPVARPLGKRPTGPQPESPVPFHAERYPAYPAVRAAKPCGHGGRGTAGMTSRATGRRRAIGTSSVPTRPVRPLAGNGLRPVPPRAGDSAAASCGSAATAV